MTVAEGGGKRAVTHKLRDMYLPTLKANYMVWPLVQIINFRLMPLQFQLVGSIILYTFFVHANISLAICVYRWNCLDCLLIPFERCRGCHGNSVSSFLTQHSIGLIDTHQTGERRLDLHSTGSSALQIALARVAPIREYHDQHFLYTWIGVSWIRCGILALGGYLQGLV